MYGNSLIKKGLAVVVILLFIGVAFAPSINANVSKQDDLVEFDVEFCGLGKKHTVKLTQDEADEVELLFDDIEQRLSEVETREGAEEIFKEAIVELDKYGLLGGLSVRQIQRMVTKTNHNSIILNHLERSVKKWDGDRDAELNNVFCFVYCNVKDSWRFWGFELNPGQLITVIPWLFFLDNIARILWKIFYLNPIRFMNYCQLTNADPGSDIRIITAGLLGLKIENMRYNFIFHIIGFSGLLIKSNFRDSGHDALYIGHAMITKGPVASPWS